MNIPPLDIAPLPEESLRGLTGRLRAKPIPLAELIPSLQKAADAFDSLRSECQRLRERSYLLLTLHETLIEEAVVSHIYCSSHDSDVMGLMRDLRKLDIEIALDPSISLDAQRLIDKGRHSANADYEALRKAIDKGSETATHEDALEFIEQAHNRVPDDFLKPSVAQRILLGNEIKASINELAEGQTFPDLMAAVDTLVYNREIEPQIEGDPNPWRPVNTTRVLPGRYIVTVETEEGREVHCLELNSDCEWLHDGTPTYALAYHFKPLFFKQLTIDPCGLEAPQ